MMVGKVVALALVGVMAGCSFMLAGEDTGFRPPKEPGCSRAGHAVFAGVDTLLAAFSFGASRDKDECNVDDGQRACERSAEIESELQATLGALFLGGAVAGYLLAGRCTYSRHKYEEWRKAYPEEARRAGPAAEFWPAPKPKPKPKPRPRPKPKLEPAPLPPNLAHCEQPLAEWRTEKNLIRKTKLFDAMPAECADAVTRKARR